ncbi:hypothetical protein DB88DRAFT_472024 [Papiliotrema laurentii]|uniref:Uncharacterized protein n=1 Tax=Papiliotrema laurentii TaxID=5418 RepID=A0AAD9FR13_PAPLA|nr:hypothetical protein DB88DRAFT_472024 [Papiliotrema laurentii]
MATALSTFATWKSWAVNRAKDYAASFSRTGKYLARLGDAEEEHTGNDPTTPPKLSEGVSTESPRPPAADRGSEDPREESHQLLTVEEPDAEDEIQAFTAYCLSALNHVYHPRPQDVQTIERLERFLDHLTLLTLQSQGTNRDHNGNVVRTIQHAIQAINHAHSRLTNETLPSGRCLTCDITRPLSELAIGYWETLRSSRIGQYKKLVEGATKHYRDESHETPEEGEEACDLLITVNRKPSRAVRDEDQPVMLCLGHTANASPIREALQGWASSPRSQQESVAGNGDEDRDVQIRTWNLPHGTIGEHPRLINTFRGKGSTIGPLSTVMEVWAKRYHCVEGNGE